jgi:hypothetical protein
MARLTQGVDPKSSRATPLGAFVDSLADCTSLSDVRSVHGDHDRGMMTTAALYRLDQLIAAAAKKSLWLTDAYFVG